MTGHVHSIESFGSVDGPGVRLVIFMQGCPMRCAYCHNPDTWNPNAGQEMSSDEIIALFLRNKPFYKDGGITLTGGEPLLQLDFVIELFQLAKENSIHTCLDTSGICFSNSNPELLTKYDHLCRVTDLVMLDIKHIDEKKHLSLTGHSNKNILNFARYLAEKDVPMWIRHVIVPGLTDDEDSLYNLGLFIGGLTNLKALDILPYHDMGKIKYKSLGIPYPLEDVPPMSYEEAVVKKKIILNGMKYTRNHEK